VAVADPSADARADFQAYAGQDSQAFESIDDLLKLTLDAIFVLSPDWLHEEHAVKCLEARVPIYLEKPMAITVEGCDRILAMAKRTGTKLYVGHNMRHFAVVRKMKELIDAGCIGHVKAGWCRHFVHYGGEAYFRDWHADQSKSTGLLLQKGAHDIDVLHWLCGGFSRRVTAMGALSVYGDITDRQGFDEKVTVEFRKTWPPRSLTKLNPVVDVEDVSMMLMELDNGVLASYQQCHFTPDAWRNYTIIGDAGRVENFGDTPGDAVIRLWNGPHGYSPTGDEEFVVPPTTGGHGGADEGTVAEFLRFLQTGAPTDATPYAARMAVAAGIAATQSLRNSSCPIEVLPLLEL
jgi:predicted dehydrogenase